MNGENGVWFWFNGCTSIFRITILEERLFEDAWVGNIKLAILYPRLYSLSLDQGKKVGEVGVWEDLGWHWRLRWRRVRFVWESAQEEELLKFISRGALIREEEDTQLWGRDSTGVFSVKSAYECLDVLGTD